MNETQMLIGSLSNDLMRVANCMARGSQKSARRFALEAKRWAKPLINQNVPSYIRKIAEDVDSDKSKSVPQDTAEKYLMYAVLLQNHVLHNLSNN